MADATQTAFNSTQAAIDNRGVRPTSRITKIGEDNINLSLVIVYQILNFVGTIKSSYLLGACTDLNTRISMILELNKLEELELSRELGGPWLLTRPTTAEHISEMSIVVVEASWWGRVSNLGIQSDKPVVPWTTGLYVAIPVIITGAILALVVSLGVYKAVVVIIPVFIIAEVVIWLVWRNRRREVVPAFYHQNDLELLESRYPRWRHEGAKELQGPGKSDE